MLPVAAPASLSCREQASFPAARLRAPALLAGHRLRSARSWSARTQRDLPGPGSQPVFLHLQADSVPQSHQGSPQPCFLPPHPPRPRNGFIFNEGRLLPIPGLASAASRGSAQAHVGSSLLTCLPPPTPPHRPGVVAEPQFGFSESHRKLSLVIILHVVVCMLHCESLHSFFNDLSASVVLSEADGNKCLENKFLLKQEAGN